MPNLAKAPLSPLKRKLKGFLFLFQDFIRGSRPLSKKGLTCKVWGAMQKV